MPSWVPTISPAVSNPADVSNWGAFGLNISEPSINLSDLVIQDFDIPWVQLTLDQYEEPTPPATLQIDSVSPNQIDQRGGHRFEVTGIFPVDSDLEVYMGTNGDTTDPRCHGGTGYGILLRSANGTTINCYSPVLNAHGDVKLTVRIVSTQETKVLDAAFTVLERNWNSKIFSMRSCFPGRMGVGLRRLEDEGRR